MLSTPPSDNFSSYLAAAISGLRAFRSAQPRLSILHLELLLQIATQEGADVDAYAKASAVPLLPTGLALREMGKPKADLITFNVGNLGRLQRLNLSPTGHELVQAFIDAEI